VPVAIYTVQYIIYSTLSGSTSFEFLLFEFLLQLYTCIQAFHVSYFLTALLECLIILESGAKNPAMVPFYISMMTYIRQHFLLIALGLPCLLFIPLQKEQDGTNVGMSSGLQGAGENVGNNVLILPVCIHALCPFQTISDTVTQSDDRSAMINEQIKVCTLPVCISLTNISFSVPLIIGSVKYVQ